MRRKLFLLSAVLFVLLSYSLVASVEADSAVWSQTYGGANKDVANSVAETSDGGYAIAGWTSSFGDGSSEFWLVKTDEFGNMEWNQTYEGPVYASAESLVVTSDGGFAIAGYSYSSGAGEDFWLIKTDELGNVEWNRTYGGEKSDERAYSLVEVSDEGYALAGSTLSYGAVNYDFWLVKTDEAGNMEWNRTYGEENQSDTARSLVVTSDGGYAIAGGNLWVKTDAYGNMEWNRTYEWTISSVVEASDWGYALAGTTDSSDSFGAGELDFLLVKTDAIGVMLWFQTYGGAGDDRAKSMVESSDGGFVLAGVEDHVQSLWDFREISGNFLLVKIDASGNIKWHRTYGGTNSEFAYSVIETSDGGYALAGRTYSFGAGSADFWLVKTDQYGIPEYSSWLLPSLLLTATLVIVICKNRLFSQSSKNKIEH